MLNMRDWIIAAAAAACLFIADSASAAADQDAPLSQRSEGNLLKSAFDAGAGNDAGVDRCAAADGRLGALVESAVGALKRAKHDESLNRFVSIVRTTHANG